MKTLIFLVTLLLLPVLAISQNRGISILPEAGLSSPLGDFKEVNVFAKQGYQFGLHLDKMWGNFGLGLYGGYDKYGIQFPDLIPVEHPGLTILKSEAIVQDSWKQLLAGIGPVLKLNLSKKVHIELTSKVGVSKFAYPDFGKFVEVADPLNQTYVLYQTKNEELKKKFTPMLLSALRLNFKVAKRLDLSLSGNYLHVRDVLHSYAYLDAGLNPNMSAQELVTSLRTAPAVSEVRKCYFNSIGATIGLSFNLAGKESKPDEKIDPPVPVYPEDGAVITMEEADSLVLEWRKEQPNVEKANYNFWLYKVSESTNTRDSLIFNTKIKRNLKVSLPESIDLELGASYRWKVQAVDDSRLKACPAGCYSVEASFTVSSVPSFQYYQLISQNQGNYVEVKGQLRVVIPRNIMQGENISGRIFNQKNEVVWESNDLSLGKGGETYTLDDYGMLSVNIAGLPEGYYVFELATEKNRAYFFRFKVEKSNGGNRN